MSRSRPDSPQSHSRSRRTARPRYAGRCDESQAHASLRHTEDTFSDCLEARWSEGITLRLAVDAREILHGALQIDVRADDQLIPMPTSYECVLWHSDRDCDYLELQAPLGEEGVLEVQVLLARPDRYAYVAIKTAGLTGAASTALTLSWPLAAAVSAAPDDQTRELLLREATRQPVYRARVFPLGLPQDRVDSTRGWLEVREGRLCLHQVGAGRGLYVPLVLDWTPERRRSPADWRTLTVAEEGQKLPTELAAAHRLRIGLEHQLLIYHSLIRSPVSRSVLGHNTLYETVIGRFSDCGNVDPVMAVE